jgi:hypothetical protein
MAGAARELIEALRTDLANLKLPALAQRLDRVLAAAESELEQLKQQNTVARATGAFDAVRDAAATFADEKGPWTATLREVQAVGADLRAELAKAELAATSRALRGAADRTGEAAASIAELRADVVNELAVLRQALQAVQRLATLLENDPGALLHGRGASPRSPLGDK